MFNSIIKLVNHKDFIVTLSRREIISQYKQSILGNLWIIIQPLGLLVVMTVVFSLFVHLPSEGVPYAAFLFVVLLPWIFFNSTVNSSSGIITGYAGLIRQRKFYRPALVFSKLLSAIVSFFISLIGLVAVFFLYQVQPGLNAFFAIPIFIIQVILMLGLMLFLSASNAYIRDFGLVTPLLLRIGRYLSPVIYSYQTVPEKYQIYLAMNPLTGIFDGYRKTLLHNLQPDWFLLLYSFIFSLVLLGIGWITFIKLENNFADVV
jgi:ABC-type polysaccharide/polyol phosphate export permease